MAKNLFLQITTPEKVVYEAEVGQVTLPTAAGEITVLSDHIPLVTRLASGDIVAMTDREPVPFAVADGFAQVDSQNADGKTTVVILADFAESVEELTTDEMIAQAKAQAAELQAKMASIPAEDIEMFEKQLEQNLIRARIGAKWKNKKYRKLSITT